MTFTEQKLGLNYVLYGMNSNCRSPNTISMDKTTFNLK